MSLYRRFLSAAGVVLLAALAFGAATTNGPATTPAGPSTLSLAGLGAVASNATQQTSNSTFGGRYFVTAPGTIIGAKWYWVHSSGNETVTTTLWNAAGSLVDSVSLVVTSSGTYSVTFPSTHTIAANTSFTVAFQRTDSSGYTNWTTAGLSIITPLAATNNVSVPFGPYTWWQGSYYGSGTAVYPSNPFAANSGVAGIDPILSWT